MGSVVRDMQIIIDDCDNARPELDIPDDLCVEAGDNIQEEILATDADGDPVIHPLNEFYRTPTMQKLGDQGIRFSQFYANGQCSPSRVSLLTGQSSARHRSHPPHGRTQAPPGISGEVGGLGARGRAQPVIA